MARLSRDGHAIVVKGEKVGDVPPHPFIRPAFDAKTEEAYRVFESELRGRAEAIWGLNLVRPYTRTQE